MEEFPHPQEEKDKREKAEKAREEELRKIRETLGDKKEGSEEEGAPDDEKIVPLPSRPEDDRE